MEETYSETFEHQVQECLNHLYDSAWLQQEALVQHLVPTAGGIQRVQAFRRMVMDMIASLKLNDDASEESKQVRVYRILQLRYIEEHQHQDIINQLFLSERQYYREHRRAIQALAFLMWDKASATSESDATTLTIRTESQRIFNQTNYVLTDVEQLLSRAVELARNTAPNQNLKITVSVSPNKPMLKMNGPLLRQLVALMLYQMFRYTAMGAALAIVADLAEDDLSIRLVLTGEAADIDDLVLIFGEHEALMDMLNVLEARIDFHRAGRARGEWMMIIPQKHEVVLLIDDNPDALSLLQRQLEQHYQTTTARNADDGVRLARELQPSVIVLDVMLPGVDGWEILLNLKNHPRTLTIPVLVCSVLETPDMALSLGADGYLKKPPVQDELLATIARLTERIE